MIPKDSIRIVRFTVSVLRTETSVTMPTVDLDCTGMLSAMVVVE